jgi:hypothetical protein
MDSQKKSKKTFLKGFAVGLVVGIISIIAFFLMTILPLPG